MEKEYTVGQSTITLHIGNIAESGAEVLVSSDDVHLSMGGGVSEALRLAAGDALYREARKVAPARLGDIAVTSAHALPAKYIFHAITLDWQRPDLPRQALVRRAVQKAMGLLSVLGCRSIAFPSVGAGVAGIPIETVATEMMEAIVGSVLDTSEAYSIELWLFDRFRVRSPEEFVDLFSAHLTQTLGLRTRAGFETIELTPPSDRQVGANRTDSGQPGSEYRARAAYEMMRRLDRRRAELEEELVNALSDTSNDMTEVLARCRRQIDELRRLRAGYEADLARLSRQADPTVAPAGESVFLSSTYLDLKAHREAVKEVIERLQLSFVGMEEFSPSAVAPASYIRERVQSADLYLGILGMRYGYVDAGTGRSMTELEYEQALASGKRLFLFVMDKDAPITVDMVETDPDAYAKLLAFRSRVLQSHMCRMFTTRDDLVQKAEGALRQARPITSSGQFSPGEHQ